MKSTLLNKFVLNAIKEDVGDGDHTSLACIPKNQKGKAQLIIKQQGIIAGIDVAKSVFKKLDPKIKFKALLKDGISVNYGDIAFTVEGNIHTILMAERLVLNIMQRMSGIATKTNDFVRKIDGLSSKIIDTRKTTPGMRFLEKAAVKIGGGENHRMGLYDMILIKDNHIDFAGGNKLALERTIQYLKKKKKKLKIIIEARSIEDVKEIIDFGKVHRILLDNFTPQQTREAVTFINKRVATESSGNINISNVRDYAECGVDYISIGSITHQFNSIDMSLKAF